MKKRVMAILLSAVMILSLSSTAFVETVGTVNVPETTICEETEGCTLEAGHEEDRLVSCGETVEPTETEISGPEEMPELCKVPENVTAFLDAVAPNTIPDEKNEETEQALREQVEAAWTDYEPMSEEDKSHDDVSAALATLEETLSTLTDGFLRIANDGNIFNVSSFDEFKEAFKVIAEANSGDFTISLTNDFVLSGRNDSDFDFLVKSSKNVTLLGNGHTITYGAGNNSAESNLTLGVKGGTLKLGSEDGSNKLTITTNNSVNHADPLIKILDSGTVDMYDGTTLTGNVCTSSNPGGVDVQDGTFNMHGGEISNNKSLFGYGGGVWAAGNTSAFNMYGGVICKNTATANYNSKSYGGGVMVSSGAKFNMTDGLISQNEATSYGGGVCVYAAYASITGGTISGNQCKNGYGGGICNYYGKMEVANCKIEDNSAQNGGGAASYGVNWSANYPGDTTFTNCRIADNEAVNGGGVFSGWSNGVTFSSCTIENNASFSWGGGIYVYNGKMELNAGTCVGKNTALVGGGLLVDGGSSVTLVNSTIQNNHAKLNNEGSLSGIGGGIFVVAGSLDAAAQGNIVCNNTAEIAASDVYAAGPVDGTSTSVKLPDAVGMNQVYAADSKGETIDGLYNDPKNLRYVPDKEAEAVDVSAEITGNVQLVASYKAVDKYTVMYTDGVEDEEIFADQITGNLKSGDQTPAFNGTPTREGYVFKGWEPTVSNVVTKDAVYVAQWEKVASSDTPTGAGDNTSTGSTTNPKTGDISNTILWMLLLVISGLGLISTLIYKCRRTN